MSEIESRWIVYRLRLRDAKRLQKAARDAISVEIEAARKAGNFSAEINLLLARKFLDVSRAYLEGNSSTETARWIAEGRGDVAEGGPR